MRKVNLETTISTLSWYKIQPLNGVNLTRARQKLLRRRKGVYESFSSRRKIWKSFILTIPWSLAHPLKICHGMIVHQRHIDPRQMALLEELHAK